MSTAFRGTKNMGYKSATARSRPPYRCPTAVEPLWSAMLVHETSPVGIERFSYQKLSFVVINLHSSCGPSES